MTLAPPAPVSGSPAPAPAGRRWWARPRYLVVMAVFAAAIGFLIAQVGGSLNYYETVDQALAHRASLGTQTFRLEGVVLPGTVHRVGGAVDFVAGDGDNRIAVENFGNPPQLFQAGIPVIVDGHFSGATFVSNQIVIDHSSNYTGKSSKQ